MYRQFSHVPISFLAAAMFSWTLLAPTPSGASEKASSTEQMERNDRWIAEMKVNSRGPFSSIKWFCRDGRVLEPKDFSCAKKGEGWQHGQWSEHTQQLRSRGYMIATLLAGIDASQAVAATNFPDIFAQMLVEKFLIATDDGWILRKAQFYRGAIQEEDEREGARRLLFEMVKHDDWIDWRFVALRTGARLLPHGRDDASAAKVRNLAAALAEHDPSFQRLRIKIHGSPDASDAVAVRAWAKQPGHELHRQEALVLADEIDRVYSGVPIAQRLASGARSLASVPGPLPSALNDAAHLYATHPSAERRFFESADLLMQLRNALPKTTQPIQRLAILDLSLAVELEHYSAAGELRTAEGMRTRSTMIHRLRAGNAAAFGTGLIGHRQYLELDRELSRLNASENIALGDYLQVLHRAALLPGWGTQSLKLQFGEAMDKLGEIEPKAALFVQDQLRGSPLLTYAQALDMLSRDANRTAGVQHKLIGQDIGTGFNALNPGLVRGVLYAKPDMTRLEEFRSDGIYVLPETVADLPPLAGILTAGAGNPLSHVQLLARNLGIPNVAVDESMLPNLHKLDGKRIVLAVSPAGLVEISEDGPQWDAVFGSSTKPAQSLTFEPDLNKLDLKKRDFVSLDQLRASDSGRIVGPKAAKLGELKSRFPDRVAPGVGIPFGVYRATILDRPYGSSGTTVYQWMVESFRKLESMPAGSKEADQYSEALRSEIYRIVLNTDPGPVFRKSLKAAMAKEFGPEFNGGVFVRSDTNVEDLPGFTGAGLNLTLFNIVGFENLIKAISEVWASPYTTRAWAWRQAHMKGPEHIYPAVLLLKTVPSDISGVMITQDVDSGDPGILSVAVNEGVGGAVEGQAAESVRIKRSSGDVRLMATATAPRRMVPQSTGDIAKLPVSGSDTLLRTNEITQLIAFANDIPKEFPQLGADGKPVAADVEFAFVKDRLWLLQIRPFNESGEARGASHLIQMDKALQANTNRSINLKEVIQ